jgi:hypothetical protein
VGGKAGWVRHLIIIIFVGGFVGLGAAPLCSVATNPTGVARRVVIKIKKIRRLNGRATYAFADVATL